MKLDKKKINKIRWELDNPEIGIDYSKFTLENIEEMLFCIKPETVDKMSSDFLIWLYSRTTNLVEIPKNRLELFLGDGYEVIEEYEKSYLVGWMI